MTWTKFAKKLVELPFQFCWFRAYSGFGQLAPENRLKRLSKLRAKDGPKQIILIQMGNILSTLDSKEQAIGKYTEALESEKAWGCRKNKAVSDYIKLYAEYRIQILRFGYSQEPSYDLLTMYDELKACRVPSSIKDYHLPLPQAPDGRAF